MKKSFVVGGGIVALSAVIFGFLSENKQNPEILAQEETLIGAPTVRVNAYGLPMVDLKEERMPVTIEGDSYYFTTQADGKIGRLDKEEDEEKRSYENAIYHVPFNGKVYVFRLSISDEAVRTARINQNHILHENGDNAWTFVSAGDIYVKEIVRQAEAYSVQENISTEELLIAFAKNIPYNRDLYTGHEEYPKYAVETLADHSGDCEDIAILAANLLGEYKGYTEVAFVYYPNHIGLGYKVSDRLVSYRKAMRQPSGHVKAGDRTYLYQEMTHPFWQLGQIPANYQNKSVTVYAYSPALALA